MGVEDFLIQLLGLVTFGVGVFAVSQKNDSNFKKFITAQAFLASLSFLFLGAMTGFAIAFLVGCRNLLSMRGNIKALSPIFIILFMVMGFFSYETYFDLMPVTSSIMATLALSFLSGIRLRLTFMACSSLWLIHNLSYSAYGPALMELMMIATGAVTVYKLLQAKAQVVMPQAAE